MMTFDWEMRKAESNYKKHGVRFSECLLVFEEDCAITVIDEESEPGETRFVTIDIGVKGRVLVVVYTHGELIFESFRSVLQSHTIVRNTRSADETTL